MNVGAAQGPSAGEIPVDQSAECLRADLSLPGSFRSFMARLFLDSGSALTSIGAGLLSRMSSSFGGAALQIPLENGPRMARTATGATVLVTHKTVPIEVRVRTPWGAVKVLPITFAVMPRSDDVVVRNGHDEGTRPRSLSVGSGKTTPARYALSLIHI